jgi:hypothetical protein
MENNDIEYLNVWAMIRLLKQTGVNNDYLKSITPNADTKLNFLEGDTPSGLDLNKPILTRKEVLALLGITPPTLDKWVSKGVLVKYGIEGKVFFKLENIMDALTKIG